MKCPRCWAPKAYIREISGWRGFIIHCLLLQPMRCHHCYHKFNVPWFLTVGKQVHPPRPRQTNAPIRRVYMARFNTVKTAPREGEAVIRADEDSEKPQHSLSTAEGRPCAPQRR